MAGAIFAQIIFEATRLQPRNQILVHFRHALHGQLIAMDDQRIGPGSRDQITIFERWAFIIKRVIHLRTWIYADNGGGTALDDGGGNIMAVQILRHIMPAIAGAQHQRLLAAPSGTAGEAVGMNHIAGKGFKPRQLRHFGNTADAIGENHMAWRHFSYRAICAAQPYTPMPCLGIIVAAQEFRAGPDIDFQRPGVMLKPIGQHVLRDVFRPGWRELHIGQVVHMHLVMQRQGMIALAPIIPDATVLFDHQRIQPQLAKPRRYAKPRLARANYQHNGVAVREGFCLFALIEPIIAAEIARIGFSAGPALTGFFLKTREFLKRRQQHPGLAWVFRRQAQHAITAPKPR